MKPLEIPQQLQPAIGHYLVAFALRRRRLALGRALARAVLWSLLWLLAWGVVDRLVALGQGARFVLLATLLTLISVLLGAPLAAMFRRRIDYRAAAMQLDTPHAPFNEMLMTVVSRSIPTQRSQADGVSRRLLQLLESELVSRVQQNPDLARLVPSEPTRRAWRVAAAAAVLVVGLCFWPWLGLPRLVVRQLLPLRGTSAVSTTRLSVEPGSTTVVQGKPLPIIARADRPLESIAMLQLSTDDKNWSSIGMSPAPDGSFVHTLDSVSRDLRYRISAGDALAGPFDVRVLRRPVALSFRMRLTYPRYMDRQPLVITNTTGAIEGPAGTQVHMTLSSSEPLASATLALGAQRIESTPPSDDPTVCEFDFNLTKDMAASLEMLSQRQVLGSGPSEMTIRATPDHPPIAKFLLPRGTSLLRPTDSTRLAYQAADDYGLLALEAQIDIEHRPAVVMTLRLGDDRLRLEDSLLLDLKQLNVAVGDIINVTLTATDRSNQRTVSDPFEMLVAALPVPPEQRLRASELREAARLASSVADDLNIAGQLLDQRTRAAARLASASEASLLLVRSLLRVGAGLREPEIAVAVGALADSAQLQASRLAQLTAQAPSEESASLSTRITKMRTESARIAPSILALWRGVRSDIVLTERRGSAWAVDPEHITVAHLRDQIEIGERELGFENPTEAQLQLRVAEAAEQLVRSTRRIDFVEAARQWAISPVPREEFLPDRLAVAAQLEATRGDAEMGRASDLRLASRAARIIDALNEGATTQPSSPIREGFVAAFSTLVREHEHARAAPGEPTPEAAAARAIMMALAGESELIGGQIALGRNASGPAPAGAAAETGAGEIEAREPALAAIREGLERLAELPQQLLRIEQATDAARVANARASQAESEASATAPEQQAAARRSAAVARQQADEAFIELAELSQVLDPDEAMDFARDLRVYAAQTASGLAAIDRTLEPVLLRLRGSIRGRDLDGIVAALRDSRRAIVAVQDGLRDARQTLLEKDPQFRARWFLQQASVLGAAPPTTRPYSAAAEPAPLRREADSTAVLRRAWDDVLSNSFWSNSNPLSGEDLSALSREPDPVGYEDSLQAYFRMLGRGAEGVP